MLMPDQSSPFEMALSPDVKDILTKKVDELMTRINLSPMFWTKLVKHGVLTYMEVDVIKGGGNFSNQQLISSLVVDYLLKGSDKRYNGFLRALLETNQEHIVTDVLKKESPQVATPASNPQAAGQHMIHQSETGPASLSDGKKAMAEGIAIKVKEEFQKDRVRLLGRYGIEVTGDLETLLDQWGILEYTDYQLVKAQSTPSEKTSVLIDKLLRRSDGCLLLFVRALCKTGGSHQLKTLNREEKTFVSGGEDDEIVPQLKEIS